MGRTLDLQEVIDRQKHIRPQLPLLSVMTLIMFLDGYDVFMLGRIAPAMAESFREPVARLTMVFLSQQVGLAVGSLLISPISDRFGRTRVLTLLFMIDAVSLMVMGSLTFGGWPFVAVTMAWGIARQAGRAVSMRSVRKHIPRRSAAPASDGHSASGESVVSFFPHWAGSRSAAGRRLRTVFCG